MGSFRIARLRREKKSKKVSNDFGPEELPLIAGPIRTSALIRLVVNSETLVQMHEYV